MPGYIIGCGMVLAQGDRYILVQETRGAKAGLYNLPSGTLEIHEDLITCVRREVYEETGVNVEPEVFLGLDQTILGDGHNVLYFLFGALVPESVVFQSKQHPVIKAFTLKELIELDQRGQLRVANVLTATQRYRTGQHHPLSILQAQHLASQPAIVVGKS